jgi:predicted membrane metal-binding protein
MQEGISDGFDYKQYLKTKGIYGIVQVSEKAEVLKKKQANTVLMYANKAKNSILNKVNIFLNNKTAGLMNGILLGYTR